MLKGTRGVLFLILDLFFGGHRTAVSFSEGLNGVIFSMEKLVSSVFFEYLPLRLIYNFIPAKTSLSYGCEMRNGWAKKKKRSFAASHKHQN